MKRRLTLAEKTLAAIEKEKQEENTKKLQKENKTARIVAYCTLAAWILIGAGTISYDHFLGKKHRSSLSQSILAPPNGLTINGESWSLQDRDYESDGISWVAGDTNCRKRIISYDFRQEPTHAYQRTILWHEIVHAAHCQGYAKDDQRWWKFATNDLPEHGEVYKLGMFLPGFVHDNPEFMKWAEDWK